MNGPKASRGRDGLVLVGARGSGKTTVGLILARRLGARSFDLDREIEAQSGQTIAEIFAEAGEEGFRDQEECVLRKVSHEFPGSIIATGGGAVLRPINRQRIREHGRVVWLQARPDELARRIAADGTSASSRPALTSAGVLQEIETVLAQRAALYAEVADDTVDSTESSAGEVASAILARWSL